MIYDDSDDDRSMWSAIVNNVDEQRQRHTTPRSLQPLGHALDIHDGLDGGIAGGIDGGGDDDINLLRDDEAMPAARKPLGFLGTNQLLPSPVASQKTPRTSALKRQLSDLERRHYRTHHHHPDQHQHQHQYQHQYQHPKLHPQLPPFGAVESFRL